MVHICYIRKQISIYLKLIFLSSVVVFSFSMVFSINQEEANKQSNKPVKIITYNNIERRSYFSRLRDRLENMKEITRKIMFQDTFSSKLMGKVNLHRWFGLCGFNVETLRQYALFPRHPNHRTTIGDLQMNLRLVNIGQRVFGYIHPPFTSWYQFGISSDDFSELWISKDHDPHNISLAAKVGGAVGDQYIVGWTAPGDYGKYPLQVSRRMLLEEGSKYYFEILHKQAKGNGHVEVAWNATGFPKLAIITSEFVSMYLEEVDQSTIRSAVVEDNKADIPLDLPNHKKHHLHMDQDEVNHTQTTYIKDKEINDLFPMCAYKPSYVVRNATIPRYTGVWRTHYSSVYPVDGVREKMVLCKDANSEQDCKGNTALNKTDVKMVTLMVMRALEDKHPRKYTLKDIVSMESNNDPATGVRYFVELDLVERKTKKVFRFSRYVYHPLGNDTLCYPKGLRWNPSETVYFIVTVKNQGRWLKHFVDNMVSIHKSTRDHNIHVIVADFNSKDVVVEDYLRTSGLPKYTVVRVSGKFHKTKAINAAANTVRTNSIIFQVDLHLEIPPDIIQQARKHCIPGIMTYNPVLMRLMCGSTPEYPVGYWESNGYGLFAVYKQDWDRFGGMNVLEYKHKWGGEDWDLVDRVLMAELEIERFKVPGLYHYFHPRRGMWNEA